MREYPGTAPSMYGTEITPPRISEEQRVANFYGLSPVRKAVRNPRGLVNFTYELDDQYFLTVYQGWTTEELQAVSEIANGLPASIPLARPIRGQASYVSELTSGPALLCPRLEGVHYVGEVHTNKYPIPRSLHGSLAIFFWEFQEGLSAVPGHLKAALTRPSRTTIGSVPDDVPDLAKPLEIYAPTNKGCDFKYPDLIHDDLERQNILSLGDKVTGVVDLDSIHAGDVLYEFGHFIFNHVFCDPNADNSTASVYIEELLRAGRIDPADIPTIYSHIYRFAISDIADFEDLLQSPKPDQSPVIDLGLLVQQYAKALSFALDFFEKRAWAA